MRCACPLPPPQDSSALISAEATTTSEAASAANGEGDYNRGTAIQGQQGQGEVQMQRWN